MTTITVCPKCGHENHRRGITALKCDHCGDAINASPEPIPIPAGGTSCAFVDDIPGTNAAEWKCPKCSRIWTAATQAICDCEITISRELLETIHGHLIDLRAEWHWKQDEPRKGYADFYAVVCRDCDAVKELLERNL